MKIKKTYTFQEAFEEDFRFKNPVPITLVIGERKFDGIEINTEEALDEFDFEDGYVSWLIIRTKNSEDLQFLDFDSFDGKEFDLYGETHGDDFICMGKANKTKREEIIKEELDEEEYKNWEDYFNKSSQFEIVYKEAAPILPATLGHRKLA